MEDAMFYAKAAGYIGAALAMGIGSVGPALGQGMIGAKACEKLGEYPETSGQIRGTMIIAMAIVESSAIYCLLIAGGLLYMAS